MFQMFQRESFPRDLDWNLYLTEVIEDFRERYEAEDPKIREIFKDKLFDSGFLPPCQIEVLDSGKEVVWLVVHDSLRKDMEFTIHKDVKNYGKSEFARRYTINSLPKDFLKSKPAHHDFFFVFTNQISYQPLPRGSREVVAYILETLRTRFSYELRETQVDVIRGSTSGLRRSISKLPQKKIREDVDEVAEKIDKALEEIKRIDEHEKKLSSMEKDIGAVRHLVGESKEYQDWRILTSSVEGLKKRPHVSKELFESEIKRLD